MLDLAVGIVQRLAKAEENDPKELVFLETCLKAGHSKTTLPCALLDQEGHGGQVQDVLLNMYGEPSSVVAQRSASATRSSRDSASRLFFHAEADDEDIDEGLAMCHMPSSSMDDANRIALDDLMNNFDSWSFDTLKLAQVTEGRPLVFAGHEAFRRNNLYYLFPIEPEKAQRFFKRAEAKYAKAQQVPYHNNLHAADVTQGVHALLGDIGFQGYFNGISCLSIVFAAIVHDIGHDGRNNNFHVNVQDDMALTYNDKSVLENFHVSQTFQLLAAEPDNNLFAGLHIDQFISVRKQVIEAVLGTDMAFHFEHLGSFKALLQKWSDDDPDIWLENAEAASALRDIVLHVVDISNPAKAIAISDRWTDLVRDEFFAQGDAEKSLDLPVSPLCDRETVKFASSQVGFMQFIVQPAFELLSPLLPAVKEVILKEVEANMKVWKERKELEGQSSQITRSATSGKGKLLSSGSM